jgi:pimeloyl-ACP methyl ester carboxylesterase
MSESRNGRIDVTGGTIYYEVRGSGPLLLLIGQPMTSGPFGPLADLLASDHTVVTYDPHGLGQSTVEDPALPVTPEIEADDLAALIAALDADSANVVGSSGGAVAGLELAASHPEKVRTVIAHEPPVAELLPDAAQIRAAVDDVEKAYLAGGSGAGWFKFISLVTHDGPVTEAGIAPEAWPSPGPDTPSGDPTGGDPTGGDATGGNTAEEQGPPVEPSAKQTADDALFFTRMLKPFTRYDPPIQALRSGDPRVVVAIGASTGDEIAGRSTRALAERLGSPVVEFPGDHGGFMADPAGWAITIRTILDRR